MTKFEIRINDGIWRGEGVTEELIAEAISPVGFWGRFPWGLWSGFSRDAEDSI
jgi:hypothetical protein